MSSQLVWTPHKLCQPGHDYWLIIIRKKIAMYRGNEDSDDWMQWWCWYEEVGLVGLVTLLTEEMQGSHQLAHQLNQQHGCSCSYFACTSICLAIKSLQLDARETHSYYWPTKSINIDLHCMLLWAIKPQQELVIFNSAHLMSSKIAWGTENWKKADKVLCSAMNESTKMAEQQHCKKGQGSHPSRWNCSAMPPNWNHSFFPL